MSRVTIGGIYTDVNNTSYFKTICAADIEIVPRKMVEMIIEKCKEVQYAWNASDEIKEYAESLLKQFEEDK